MASSDLLRQAVDAARAGRRVDARTMLLELVEQDPRNEMAWMWLSGLVDDLEDRIIACENVLSINSTNERVREYLAELQHQKSQQSLVNQQITAQINYFDQNTEKITVVPPRVIKADEKDNPLFVAEQLELEGKYSEALEIYKVQAGTTKDLSEFDGIYKRITRIEKMQDEKIHHVSPGLSITRLAFTWPLLYLSLAFIQVGLNPFAHPVAYLWLGFPFVLLGGFLLAISETKQGNLILKKIFLDDRSEIGFVRTAAVSAGWIMIVVPMILIALDSIHRLAIFQIPPRLFP